MSKLFLGTREVTPAINFGNSSTYDWGQYLRGDIEVDNTFICAPQFCWYNETITSFSAPNVTEVSSLYRTFFSCSNLATVNLSALQKVYAHGLYDTFCLCAISSISFDSLNEIGSDGLNSCFRSCTSLQSASFPALTTTSFGSYKNQFANMMSGTGTTTTHTLHFPSNLESTISTLTGYPLFGGTSGYVVCAFDLPATS